MAKDEGRVCECEGDHGLFIWRGDPEWASCMCCDQRVRPLTEVEKDSWAKLREGDGATNGDADTRASERAKDRAPRR